ncbi:12192_t:CDS:2 [Acaulospora colombiana]|uniref:12192_t:CDS:1 n=1 Tax=Acaulospora colombiana TaxID=27376 RepID=A0ACA9KXU8_9GLOM|nr:12192_t:CDS:2 [Acaulospora colombiana]
MKRTTCQAAQKYLKARSALHHYSSLRKIAGEVGDCEGDPEQTINISRENPI